MNTVMTCDTAEGRQTFVTPSSSDPFRTPDGRLVPGRPTEQTPERYRTEIIQYFITSGREIEAAPISLQSAYGRLGDETADLIMKLTGPNALTEAETRNVLALIHGAFEKPESIAPSAKDPSRSLQLLRNLANLTNQGTLKRQIAETIAYVQGR